MNSPNALWYDLDINNLVKVRFKSKTKWRMYKGEGVAYMKMVTPPPQEVENVSRKNTT